MRFFCCCQSDARTPCQNCAYGGLGNPNLPNASCPAGSACGTATPSQVFPFGPYTTCLAPAGSPCCGNYQFTASGSIYPRWCRLDPATGLCTPGTATERSAVTYQVITCASNPPPVNCVAGPCEQYRSNDPVSWSITSLRTSYYPAGNPGFCDIDTFGGAAPAPVTTTTISGDWRTDVQVQATWFCRSITIQVSASWLVRSCEGAVPGCLWRGAGSAVLTAVYRLSPGSGACNRDGNYVRISGNATFFPPPDRWHFFKYVPPTYPVDCPDCLEFGGTACDGDLDGLPPDPNGWQLDQETMLAGMPSALQVAIV